MNIFKRWLLPIQVRLENLDIVKDYKESGTVYAVHDDNGSKTIYRKRFLREDKFLIMFGANNKYEMVRDIKYAHYAHMMLIALICLVPCLVGASSPALISGPQSPVAESAMFDVVDHQRSFDDRNVKSGRDYLDGSDAALIPKKSLVEELLTKGSEISGKSGTSKTSSVNNPPSKSTQSQQSKKLNGGSKLRSSHQHLLHKLKAKSLALKGDSKLKFNSQQKDFKSSEKMALNNGDVGDNQYQDHHDPDLNLLEIKTESPPSRDEEPVYKDCPMFANGELVGVRPHGAQWSDGDDQCELCACDDGEERCYYHYCNGPKIGFITPPSAETPTTSNNNNNENNLNLFKPFASNADPILSATTSSDVDHSKTEIEDNNIVISNGAQRVATKNPPISYRGVTVPETEIESTEESEDESSGMQPWSLTDDEDANYEYNYNNHGNHLNAVGNFERSPKVDSRANSGRFNQDEQDRNSASRQNHVVFMEDYGDSFEAFDPLQRFKTINNAEDRESAKGSVDSLHHSGSRDSAVDHKNCDTDCGKSCPYGYKITPGIVCPTCKCVKCKPLVDCKLYCSWGYRTDDHSCPICSCITSSSATIFDNDTSDNNINNNELSRGPLSTNKLNNEHKNFNSKIHHTLDGIQDTRVFSMSTSESGGRHPKTNINNSSSSSSTVIDDDSDDDASSIHKNDVTYDRRHEDDEEEDDDVDVVNRETTTSSTPDIRKHKSVVDPHNHFYDNAFNILKEDELSILRDEDLEGNGDGHHVDSSDNNDNSNVNNNNNDHLNNNNNIKNDVNNRNILGAASVPADDLTTVSSIDDVYDVDYNVEYDDGDEDLTTTVDWEEVERRKGGLDGPAKDCNTTGCEDPTTGARYQVGSTWRKDACTLCRCYARGYAECTVTQCSPPMGNIGSCTPPSHGECCPRCDLRIHESHHSPIRHPGRGVDHHPPPPHPESPTKGGQGGQQHQQDPPHESEQLLQEELPRSGGAVKEPVRSDLSSICLAVVGLVGTTSVLACLAIHYWRRYHSAKYDIAGTITAEEAQKLRPVKRSEDTSSVTCPLQPAKCV